MHTSNHQQHLPLHSLEPDETGIKHFRVYNFEGCLPNQAEMLIPHRKDYYLIVFMRKGGNRHWIDMTPFTLKANSVYFMGPNQVILKEGFEQLYSTGIAFSKDFLAFHENASFGQLPLLQNPKNGHELLLTAGDVIFVEEMIAKINAEYQQPSEWQQRMLSAYLTVLVTYLSRLYSEQYKKCDTSAENALLKRYLSKISEHYSELHEVSDYAPLLNISAGHLSDVVKAKSGKPAIKHIHERLILEAWRLLFHTDNSLKEIAFDLGFSDASYFNRFFKRETGITPVEYRASIREMSH